MRLMFFLGLFACSKSLEGARSDAASEACDLAERCGSIGTGKEFVTRSECITKREASLVDLWPAAECDGKIDSDAFDFCITAIKGTQCGNGLDFLNTTFNKCGKAQVCK
jgi:hypothetical protein